MDKAIEELVTIYKTYGFKDKFCRLAEKAIVNNNHAKIQNAIKLAKEEKLVA